MLLFSHIGKSIFMNEDDRIIHTVVLFHYGQGRENFVVDYAMTGVNPIKLPLWWIAL